MALRGYSGQAVTGSWSVGGTFGTIDIVDGRIDGVFVQTTRQGAPRWVLEGDGQGNETRVKQPRRSRAIAITLSRSSPTNAILSSIATADDLTENLVGMMLFKDLSGNTLMECDDAFLEDIPELNFATARGEVTWVFLAANVRPFIGGHDLE